MARWDEVLDAAPELAREALALLDAHRHKTLATLRPDGSPRISGIETVIHGGDVYLGMIWGSGKARDLQRDPRFALHTGSTDPPDWAGDATVSGRAVEETDPDRVLQVLGEPGKDRPEGPAHMFRLDIDEVTVVRLGNPPDHIVVTSWRPGRGIRRVERR
ncbi:MAG: pyridoxamine 5'-phosphate oxidase family protein [Actinomycetota bacterium]